MPNPSNMGIFPDLLVSTEWLAEHLDDPRLVVLDIRGYVKTTDLGGGRQKADYLAAGDEYEAAHIPGSIFIDWTVDIVDPNNPVKAQVALPDRFTEAMEVRGVGNDSSIVCVDHTGGHFATRLWWTLTFYGHDAVAVLDGGYQKWLAEGRPVTADQPRPQRSTFTVQTRPDLRSEWNDVVGMIGDDQTLIVDVRDREQYTGEVQRHTNGGHVPGAVSIPAKQFFNADGTWKPLDQVQGMLAAGGVDGRRVAAYCNGGVTATSVLFALARTGNMNWTNYDGSWNEWGERTDLPNELGEPRR